LRAQVEQFETNYPKLKGQLDFKANLILPCIDRLSRDTRLLDLIEDLLGPDLLHWNSTFRIKEPKTRQHAAWHQDTAYIKLKPFLSICWLALSSANSKSGCLRVIPGSHLGPLLGHSEGNDPDSILSRAQYIDETFDQSGAIDIELAPGEATVINHAIIHASSPNQSDDRRIGLLMDYLPTSAVKEGPRDTAILVRGEDHFGHFKLETGPVSDDPLKNIEHQRRSLEVITETMYAHSQHKPKGLS
ncbi:MAG: hypothetical protein HOA43_08950, partial [Acidiferrobacteraceae bacterium]|nr:hypothetical protein [Acidiferrobacteraceae bacterium]